ncbi:MAG: SDR family NAD(P)-dependent oxidoreductase [Kiritimatiellia bacterium]
MTADVAGYVLVTGASSGIGRGIAVRLAREGRLILHGRDMERLEETRKLCAGEGHLIWPFDLANVEDLPVAMETFVRQNDVRVKAFVHSAGMVSVMAARTMDLAMCRQIMDVNFTSAMLLISTLLKRKVAQSTLRNVLFVSSIWSRFGARGHALYSASKGAMDSAMRALALELAPQVRVNSICPGAVPSKMAQESMQDEVIAANLKDQYPLGLGTPEDVAEMAAFILSEKARWITGQQFFVDGGRTVNMSLK